MKYQLMPDLPPEDYEALRLDIEKNGVIYPIVIDEETGEVLDGHHRKRAAEEVGVPCPSESRRFDSEIAKRVFVRNINEKRRQLTKKQRAMLREQERADALELNQTHTQEQIAAILGVPRSTIEGWLATNDESVNGCEPVDHRRKLTEEDEKEIAERVAGGESVKDVAEEKGVTEYGARKAAERATSGRSTIQRLRDGLAAMESPGEKSRGVNASGLASRVFYPGRKLLFLYDNPELCGSRASEFQRAVDTIEKPADVKRVFTEFEELVELALGEPRRGLNTASGARGARNEFDARIGTIAQACREGAKMAVPPLNPEAKSETSRQIVVAISHLRTLKDHIKEAP